MTKSDFMTCLNAEIRSVFTSLLWSLHGNWPLIVLTGLYCVVYLDRQCSHIVSTTLEKYDITWPCNFSTISVNPLFGKNLTRLHFFFVAKAFFDKAAFISRLFVVFLVFFNDLGLIFFAYWNISLTVRRNTLIYCIFILANQFKCSLVNFSNLQHRMINMDT